MQQPSRLARGTRFVGAVLTAAMILSFAQFGAVYAAATTGIINGTVTDATSKAPISAATVSVISPTTTAKTTTNAQGFFSLTGLTPDTYAVSITATGYSQLVLQGITVIADQAQTLTPTVSKALANIGRTAARSTVGAFQPSQTQNTYTVNSAQIATIQGNPSNISESNLLTSLPGASLDSSGYPVLRGGRENEEGYQFEGISYTDPITNQFVNSLTIHGAQSFQLIPGAGPASTGNSGTGTVNIIAKRGSRPSQSQLEFEDAIKGPQFFQMHTEYGFATPNGRLSNYSSFVGQGAGQQVGARGTRADEVGAFDGLTSSTGRDFINNFVYKFGKDNSQSLQFLYQNQVYGFKFGYGNLAGLTRIQGDPNLGNLTPLPFGTSDLAPVIGGFPGFGLPSAQVIPFNQQQPNATFKLEYDNNLNASTFLQLAYYKVNAVGSFNEEFLGFPGFGGINQDQLTQGGLRTGYRLDVTKQVGSRHVFQAGGRYEYLLPVDNSISYDFGLQTIFGLTSNIGEGFIVPTNPTCQGSLPAKVSATNPFGTNCGFLRGNNATGTDYFPNGVTAPAYFRVQSGSRADYGFYLSDVYSPNSKLKVEAGLRLDGADYHFYPQAIRFASSAVNTFDPVGKNFRNPTVLEPRLAATLRLGQNDSVRASYGLSTQFAPLGFNQRIQDPNQFTKFKGIPVDARFGSSICGIYNNQPCVDYADQLNSIYQRRVGLPYQPTLPATFANWDASYSHAFTNDTSVRLTPFYRRGYNQIDRVASVQGFNALTGRPIQNPTVSTNAGQSYTTGVEFLLSKENRNPYGFSGQISATYINEFTNVIPNSASEDFFPTVPAASLAAGNLYRVGFVSPFQATASLEYRTKNGFRIVPQVTYNRGYPIGPGTLTATFINGQALNVPLTDYTGNANAVSFGQYIDPQNPGSLTNPNINSTLGIKEGTSAGSLLTKANLFTNLTIEYGSPRSHRGTVGLQIFNLFNQLYSGASLNGRLQPVATGISGPQTGQEYSFYAPFLGTYGFSNYNSLRFGQNSFINVPNNSPTSANLYYRIQL